MLYGQSVTTTSVLYAADGMSHVVTRWQDDQRGSLENTGALAHGGEDDCLESPRFHTI